MKMKKLIPLALVTLIAAPLVFAAPGSAVRRKLIANGLYGKIRLVQSGEDFRVYPVSGSADLSVYITSGDTRKPGEWKFVASGEDFKVKITSGLPADLTVKFINKDKLPASG